MREPRFVPEFGRAKTKPNSFATTSTELPITYFSFIISIPNWYFVFRWQCCKTVGLLVRFVGFWSFMQRNLGRSNL